ncbi:hypothetical protein [Streptomyces sp. 2P-4]|uniref:hypothetical protein n=1 Tax=Streptomyces sp. 2P-4 TaxID=2931974 RepID=UPI00254181A5|nr:hypothetical protein [Streptomyces sp. 2P-4]
MTPDQAHARAALILIRRLVQNHGLTVEEAVTAVAQRRRGETGPHTQLVAREATAVVREAAAPIRAALEALRPAFAAATAAMAELARALRAAIPSQPAASTHRDRPAWATPYGPPPRQRRFQ